MLKTKNEINKRILIVEDEPSIAEIERDYLEINGYEAFICFNGKEAIEIVQNSHFDLILLDIILDGIDGFEICRQFRKKLDIPILIVTAKKEDIDKMRGLGLGADDYIVKPFSPNELMARVGTHLARYDRLTKKTSPNNEDDLIKVADLVVNPKSRRIFVDSKEVRLKNKEFDLLMFLMLNPDTVFSKDILFEKVWSMDSTGDNSTVTVHINKLREKIEKEPSNPQYIETVWGAGYRFRN